MKVSKVGKGSYHLRTGVKVTGTAKEPGQQGILYYVPKSKQQNDTEKS